MATITLEMVDEVINRTGADYGLAKEALEYTDGDVLEAVIYIQSLKTKGHGRRHSGRSAVDEILDTLRDLINKGVVNKIIVVKKGKVIMDIPVIIGGAAALFAAPFTVAGLITAIITGCDIIIVRENGEEINVKDVTEETFKNVVNAAEKTASDVKEKFDKDKKTETKEETEEKTTENPEDAEPFCCNEEYDAPKENEHYDDYIVETRFMEDGGVVNGKEKEEVKKEDEEDEEEDK